MTLRIALLALLLPFAALAQNIPAPPSLEGKSYALMDYDSGQVFADVNADQRVEPASITKVLTVYVVMNEIKAGHAKLDDQVLISEKAWRQGKDSTESRMFIEVGKRVALGDLLRGIIIASGNDATVAIAEHLAGSEPVFAELMNQTAKKLGMKNSRFADASGMPHPEHYTTARDLLILGAAFIRDFPETYKLFAEREFVFNNIKQPNRNLLLDLDPNADGIKTGHTQAAGYCLLSSSVRDGRRLIAALMGSSGTRERARDSKALLDYGFRFYETARLYGPHSPAATLRVWKGETVDLPVGTLTPVALALPRGTQTRLSVSQQVDAAPIAPVEKGQRLGLLTISLDGKVLRTEPLVALSAVPEGGLWTRTLDSIRLWFE